METLSIKELATFYCDCVQPSMQKPISETEYECFDCGKEVKKKNN